MEYKALCEIATVTSSKRIFAEQYVSEGVPFYRQKEIIEKHDKKQLSDPLYISEEVYENIKSKFGIPKKGDLLLSAVGVTLGIPYIVQNEKFYFKDGNLIWLKDFKKDINSKYIYYWIDSKFGLESIFIRAIGSAQPALTIDLVKKYKIFFPEKSKQDKIVKILSRYDEAIENNNKRIKLLEQMAQNLYKEWFVRFRFPGWQNTEFENEIPKGWKVEKLEDFGIILESGSRPSGGVDINLEEGIPSLGAECIKGLAEFDYSNIKYIPLEFYEKMKRGKNKGKHILLYKDGAYIGKVTLFRNQFPFKKYAINEHVFFLNSQNNNYLNWLFFTLKQDSYFNLMQNLNRNAAQPGLSQPDICRIKIRIPSEDVVIKFNEFIEPIFNNVFALAKANKILAKQRNLLLPRLMSGKLEV